MVKTWRVLDTGLAAASRNIALNRALLEARAADEIPSTLRFLRYTPSVTLGCSQSAAHEVHLAECEARAIPIQRRVTGGGAWLMDERQLGWELYLHRRDMGRAGAREVVRRVGHAAATALSALGFAARFRARGEIEVDGRALCALAYVAEGEALLLQGALRVVGDPELLARVLRGPGGLEGAAAEEAFRARETALENVLEVRPDLAAVRRNLVEAFESEFDVEFREGDLGLTENARCVRASAEIDTQDWVDLAACPSSDMLFAEAQVHAGAGALCVSLKYERSRRIVRQAWFTGAPGVPPRTLRDLEAALTDCARERLEHALQRFYAGHGGLPGSLDCAAVLAAIRRALGESLAA